MDSLPRRLQNLSNHLHFDAMPFARLVRFESLDDGKIYYADLGGNSTTLPSEGSQLSAYSSFNDLIAERGVTSVSFGKLFAPLPRVDIPIYCVGLNYKSHAEEAKLSIPANPMLWCKPAAALANPTETIPMNKFCASSLPDYEGELVFVTSRECRDLSPEQAESYILGYTIGNDISCRLHQLPEKGGGQYFFAKGFDKFAPIGPVLVSQKEFRKAQEIKLITKLNGEVMQEVECFRDFIWTPAQILSHMSQGTTIPAGTAVMTGTPTGVGAFRKPARFLKNNDVVEVAVTNIGALRNVIVFQEP